MVFSIYSHNSIFPSPFYGSKSKFLSQKKTRFSLVLRLWLPSSISFPPGFALFCSPFPQGRGTRAECAGAALVGAALYQALGDEVEGHKGGAGCHDRWGWVGMMGLGMIQWSIWEKSCGMRFSGFKWGQQDEKWTSVDFTSQNQGLKSLNGWISPAQWWFCRIKSRIYWDFAIEREDVITVLSGDLGDLSCGAFQMETSLTSGI